MKLGRNDPCHCGSGRKYKHCHYDEDRAAEAKAHREAAEAAAKNADHATSEDGEAAPAERGDAAGRRDDSKSHSQRSPSTGKATKFGGNGPRTAPRATRGAQRGS